MLKRNSFNVHWKFGACQKWEPAGLIGDFEIFFQDFAQKATRASYGSEYWMNAICLEKLWNTAFCPRSVW